MEKSQIQQFLNFIKQDANIEEEVFKRLLKLFELRVYKNKDHIIDPTEEKSSIFFILSGLIRYYYLASYLGITEASLSRISDEKMIEHWRVTDDLSMMK